ncbi:MAG: hypothetical protein DRN27_04965 [Thermoplasmata archaeon]|nr:MAG: hypothetical protein DRN27_04965 [Thermoplasmata archaeon]
MRILRDTPNHSVILFPESTSLLSRTIQRYSINKNLFIIFNNDVIIDGKTYIAMRAIDKGKYQWTVRKFKLWHSDFDDGFTPSEPEPFVEIRGRITGIYICYDAVVLFKEYQTLIDKQIEILMIPSNWDFNFELMERIIDFSLEHIHTLKAVIFSNSNTFSLIKTRTQEKRITETGFVQLEI